MDWSNMPTELLEQILSNVSGQDRDNFSLVCASWNKVRATSSLYSKSPCLVFANRASHSWRVYQHNSYFSIDFSVPDNNATIRCSKHGWSLMSRDDDTLFFFDFFNNQKIEVPNAPTRGYITLSFFHPPTSSKCFIIGIDSFPMTIGFLRHGEDKWKVGKIHLPKHLKFKPSLALPVLYNEKIYFLDVRGNIATVDTEAIDMNDEDQIDEHGEVFSKCHKQRRSQRNIKEQFLVKPEGEETIFAVFVMHADRKVKIFKLLDDIFWERVHDLGDKVFYVSNALSFGYTTNNKRMANKIFFPKFHDDKIVFYSLDTQKYHSFEGKYLSGNSNGLKKYELATWMTHAPILQFPSALLTWCSQGDDIVS